MLLMSHIVRWGARETPQPDSIPAVVHTPVGPLHAAAVMGPDPDDDKRNIDVSSGNNPDGTDCVVDWSLDFAAAAEGEITPERAARLAHHIAQCDGCRLKYAMLLNDAEFDENDE